MEGREGPVGSCSVTVLYLCCGCHETNPYVSSNWLETQVYTHKQMHVKNDENGMKSVVQLMVFYQCKFPCFGIVLQLYNMSPLGTTLG